MVAVDERAVECPPRTASVLVNEGAHVHLGRDSVHPAAHNYGATSLIGTRLGPPHLVTVDDNLTW